MNRRNVNIMPMAGEGKRFKKEGYKTPKPLIDINGEPMFIKSAKCMPDADLWIFIMQKKYLENDIVVREINNNFKKYKIITVDQVTKGQANSCVLAKKYLEKDDQIFISACDNFIEFDIKAYNKKLKECDVLVFTTQCNKTHQQNPKSYGWIKKNNAGILDVSCKKPFSSNPVNDRIIIGTFAFKGLDFFIKSIDSLFRKKIKINNEYYLDMALSETINLGFNVGEIIVNKFINWGTPDTVNNSKNDNFNTFN